MAIEYPLGWYVYSPNDEVGRVDEGLVNIEEILSTKIVPMVMSTMNGFVKLTITPVALGVAAVHTVET